MNQKQIYKIFNSKYDWIDISENILTYNDILKDFSGPKINLGCPILIAVENNCNILHKLIKNKSIIFDEYEKAFISFIDNKVSNKNGISYLNSEGVVSYYLNNNKHRLDGPALINKDKLVYYVDNVMIVSNINDFKIKEHFNLKVREYKLKSFK